MSSCEKCWSDHYVLGIDYGDLVKQREANPCTPEEQAGPDATQCPTCQRLTLHQSTGECMYGCGAALRR